MFPNYALIICFCSPIYRSGLPIFVDSLFGLEDLQSCGTELFSAIGHICLRTLSYLITDLLYAFVDCLLCDYPCENYNLQMRYMYSSMLCCAYLVSYLEICVIKIVWNIEAQGAKFAMFKENTMEISKREEELLILGLRLAFLEGFVRSLTVQSEYICT